MNTSLEVGVYMCVKTCVKSIKVLFFPAKTEEGLGWAAPFLVKKND